MSSTERLTIERSIRRLEYMHQWLASALICTEEDIADLKQAIASDDAGTALRIARSAEARAVSIPAQRQNQQQEEVER
jgi:hypothetical protein